jgi:6-phosphogluconolactonase
MRLFPSAALVATLSQFVIASSIMLGAAKHLDQTNFIMYVGSYGKGISAFRFDAHNGHLQPLGMVGEVENPSFLATDREYRYLYAASEVLGDKEGAVAAFAVNRSNGSLHFLNSLPSAGLAPCHVAVDHSSKMVMVANYTSGGVSAFPIEQDGRLGPMSAFMNAHGHGPHERQNGPHAHEVVISADNRMAYVPDLGLDRVRLYRLDPAHATLTPNEPAFAKQDPGMGPRHLSFSPDEKFAYVMNELKSEVSVFSHDAATGNLTKIQDVSTLPHGFSGANAPAEILVDSAGRFVYATNRGSDSIAVFAIDGSKGTLRQVQVISSEGVMPRGFEIDPSGHFAFAGNQETNSFVVYKIDAQTGQLTPTGQNEKTPSPVSFTFVPVK